MKQISQNIRQYPNEDIPIDLDLLRALERDMRGHNGTVTVGRNWKMSRFFPGLGRAPIFTEMLGPWVGKNMLKPVTPEVLESWGAFIEHIDTLGLLPKYANSAGEGRMIDLSTIIDVNMIYNHLPEVRRQPMRILEIGGGYGRLAEAILGVFNGQVQYVLVDAVPVTLVYAYQYLSRTFPGLKIGLYTDTNHLEIAGMDCAIVPSWRFEGENCISYDIGVCIASMQEMDQEQVNYYIDLLRKLVPAGSNDHGIGDPRGLIYLRNSRDYFKRVYPYPATWKLLYKSSTPQSLSPDFPVEIFRPTGRDCLLENHPIEIAYTCEVLDRYREGYWKKEIHEKSQARQIEALRNTPLRRLWRKIR